MKIYIVRHEKRYSSPIFQTSLTAEGVNNSIDLAEQLNSINFDIIYSSPFLRTIQTAFPYCKKYNKKLNLEYSLYECTNDKRFNKNNYHQSWTSLKEYIPDIENHINHNYYSLIDRVNFPESSADFANRLITFTDKTIYKYKNSNKNILFVTHMSPVIELLKLYKKESNIFYKEGKVTLLYDTTIN